MDRHKEKVMEVVRGWVKNTLQRGPQVGSWKCSPLSQSLEFMCRQEASFVPTPGRITNAQAPGLWPWVHIALRDISQGPRNMAVKEKPEQGLSSRSLSPEP